MPGSVSWQLGFVMMALVAGAKLSAVVVVELDVVAAVYHLQGH